MRSGIDTSFCEDSRQKLQADFLFYFIFDNQHTASPRKVTYSKKRKHPLAFPLILAMQKLIAYVYEATSSTLVPYRAQPTTLAPSKFVGLLRFRLQFLFCSQPASHREAHPHAPKGTLRCQLPRAGSSSCCRSRCGSCASPRCRPFQQAAPASARLLFCIYVFFDLSCNNPLHSPPIQFTHKCIV